MTSLPLLEYVLLDTTTVGHLTKQGEHTHIYDGALEGRKAAISFQVDAELLSSGYGPSRQMRLDLLRAGLLYLPHSRATNRWYARVSNVRKALRRGRGGGRDAGDADMWIIATALEHGLALVAHDRHQILLAVETGVRVFTNIRDLRYLNSLPVRSDS